MKSWYSASELKGMPGLPRTVQNVTMKAKREGWAWRPRQGRGGGKEYSIASLPAETAAFLRERHGVVMDGIPVAIHTDNGAGCSLRTALGQRLIRLGELLLRNGS